MHLTMYQIVGYKIIIKKTNYKIFHITDTASVEHLEAKNYDLLCVEANYKKTELQERKEKKLLNGEYEYEDRVENTHLSEEAWIEFMLRNASPTSECVKLHQHIERSKNG